MMPYETYMNLLRQLDDLVTTFEHHPDPTTQEQVAALLSGLDMLHREGLRRLVGGRWIIYEREQQADFFRDPVDALRCRATSYRPCTGCVARVSERKPT
jgi:hypothetical protein